MSKKAAKKPTKKASKKPSTTAKKPSTKKKPSVELSPVEVSVDDIIDFVEDDNEPELDNLEGEDMDINFTQSFTEDDSHALEQEYDFFESCYNVAKNRNQFPRFYIKKDGQLLGSMNYPCSWEILQKTYGGGHYNIQARDAGTGRYIKSISELVAEPLSTEDDYPSDFESSSSHSGTNTMELLAMMNRFQEQSESKVRESTMSQSNSFAAMLQTMMSSQQESSLQMQLMIMEMNKQSQTQAQSQQQLLTTLLTTMLTQKPSEAPKSDFNALTVLKMIQDAEKNAETRTKSWFELIDRKAEALAEEKAASMKGESEGEESFTKSLVKGFIPVISQMVQAQGQAQPQASLQAQELEAHKLEQQQLMLQKARAEQQRQAVLSSAKPAKPSQAEPPARQELKNINTLKKETKDMSTTTDDKLRENIVNICQSDIAQGFILSRNARSVATHCVKKLEKANILRQDVIRVFKLDDFFALAERYGVLERAKPWITEFYETLVKEEVAGLTASAPTASKPAVQPEII